MKGIIKDIEVETSDEEEETSEEEQQIIKKKPVAKSGKSGGMFSIFKSLVGSKNLSIEDMQPALEKMKDHLIAKNVASDIALKLCDSVAKKLEGKVLGTFDSIANTVKNTLTESLVQILSPKRRVDILRDCMEAKKQGKSYVMTFCGVSNKYIKEGFLLHILLYQCILANYLTILFCQTFYPFAVLFSISLYISWFLVFMVACGIL